MNLLNLFFFALVVNLPSAEGFFKKIFRETKRVVKQAADLPKKVVREADRIVHQAADLPKKVIRETDRIVHQVGNFPKKRTTTSLDGTTRNLELGKPHVAVDHQHFEVKTYEELVGKLREMGIEDPEEFSRQAMEALEKSKVEWRFFLPAMDAPDDKAKMSVIGIIATKEDSAVVAVTSSRMSAEFDVKATETFHWRTQVKHWGNNHERKNDVTQIRGLTLEEVKVIYSELVSAIESHPDFASLPGSKTSSFADEL
jgi:hypothetical protein